PDAERWSVTEPYFDWITDHVAEMLIDYARHAVPTLRYHRWSKLLNHEILPDPLAVDGRAGEPARDRAGVDRRKAGGLKPKQPTARPKGQLKTPPPVPPATPPKAQAKVQPKAQPKTQEPAKVSSKISSEVIGTNRKPRTSGGTGGGAGKTAAKK